MLRMIETPLNQVENRARTLAKRGISTTAPVSRSAGLPATRILCLALALLPGEALAQNPVTAEDPEAMAEVMQELGFQARIGVDGVGDPMIRSSASGSRFQVYFYGCTDNTKCQSIQFVAGFDLPDGTSLDVINDWNRGKRFVSAFVDDEDDPFIQMDVTTNGGISYKCFEATLMHWQSLLGAFKRHITQSRIVLRDPRRRRSTV